MIKIKTGKINDVITYAFKEFPDEVWLTPAGGKKYATHIIYSDSGVIPGVAQDHLEEYICKRAEAYQ